MGRKIRITEEQYQMALKEGVTLKVPTNNGKNLEQNIKDTKAQGDYEVKDGNYTLEIDPKGVQENKLVSKKELQENRLKKLKENSEVYTVKDFIKKFK